MTTPADPSRLRDVLAIPWLDTRNLHIFVADGHADELADDWHNAGILLDTLRERLPPSYEVALFMPRRDLTDDVWQVVCEDMGATNNGSDFSRLGSSPCIAAAGALLLAASKGLLSPGGETS